MNEEKKTDTMTSLSAARTRLAADRTLMAWIRTSFAMIGFGFAILKFFEFLRSETAVTNLSRISDSARLGAFLMLLGVFALIPGMIEHRKMLKSIKAIDPSTPLWTYAFLFSILVGIIGLYALISSFSGKFF